MSALGSLVVSLGLEYAQFTGGLDKSEQAALQASKRIQDTMDGLKSKLAATAGAIAGGLAAGFTIAAFKNIISGAIETGAALDDLRMQTGASVEALSGLMAIGKFNNMGPEQIGSAMNKLAANLAGATEESKGAGKALEALGLDFAAFKQMRPEDQMQTVSKAMAGFEDGTGKAAVAMALYGKQGAQMLPFLHDLAEVGQLQAKVSTEQAAAAANLDDNITRLSTSGEAWKKELANGMIPTIDLGTQALVDMMDGTGGLREQMRLLAADGSIARWTSNTITGFTYLIDVVQGLVGAAQIAGLAFANVFADVKTLASSAFMGMAAIKNLKFGEAADIFSRGLGDMSTRSQQFKKDFDDLWNPKLKGEQIRDSMLHNLVSSIADAGEASNEAKPSLNGFANTTDKVGKAAADAKDPFDALRYSIVKATAAYQAETTAGEKLTEGQKKAIEALDQLRTGRVKVAEAQAIQIRKDIEAMLAAEGENKAREKSAKVSEAAAQARQKETDGIRQWFEQQENIAAQSLAGVNDRISGLRDEAQALGLAQAQNISLAEAVEQVVIARLEEKQARFHEGSEGYLAVQKEIEARKELLSYMGSKAQRDSERRGWTDMWQSVDRTAHDVFTNVFDGGSNVFKKLGQTLKASVLDVLYQMTVRKWIISIGTSVMGSGFGAAANAATGGAGAASDGASMLGNVGSLVGMGSSAFGIGASYGATSLFANGLGATLSAGSSMIGAGSVMSGIGTIAGALGPIALGVAAVMALVKSLDDSGTPHSGAGAIYSASGGMQEGSGIYGKSVLGMGSPDEYSAAMQSGISSMAKGIAAALDGTAKSFGKTAGYEITTAFADDSSKDGAWGALKIKLGGQSVLDWADTAARDGVPKEFGNGEEGAKQYAVALGASMRTVLDGIGLPGWATSMLDKLGEGATIEQLAGAVDQINAAKAAFDGFGQYMPEFLGLTDAAIGKLVGSSGGVAALAGNMSAFVDGFYTDAEKLAVNAANVRGALDTLGVEMPATADDFKALVQAQIELGDGGAELAAKLLQLAPAVGQVVEAERQLQQVRDTVALQMGINTGATNDYIYALAQAAGGMDALQGKSSRYYDKFFTDAEKSARTIDDARASLASVGLQMPTTAQGARALMDAAIGLGAAGQDTVIALLNAVDGMDAFIDGVNALDTAVQNAAQNAANWEQPVDLGGLAGAVRGSWTDLIRGIVDDTRAATDELQKLTSPKTSYQIGLESIQTRAADRTKEYWTPEREQAVGALVDVKRQQQSQWENNAYGYDGMGPEWAALADFSRKNASDLATEIASLIASVGTAPAEIQALIDAETALLDARNKASADKTIGGLMKEIEQLDMTPLEKQLASIDEMAVDYIKSLQDLGQATDENIKVIDEWEAAMRLDAIKKAWAGVTDSILGEIDRISGSLSSDGGMSALQADFAIKTAAARAGDVNAGKDIAGLSGKILQLSEASAGSAFEWARGQAQMLASLQETARITALRGQGKAPPSGALQMGSGTYATPQAYPPAYESASQASSDTAALLAEVKALNRRLETLEANTQATALHTQKTAKALERAMPGGDAIATREVI